MNPLLLVDTYKIHHFPMYPDNMTTLYSNLTPRKSRLAGINRVVVWGLQHAFQTYLIDAFRNEFFNMPKGQIIEEYKRHCNVDTTHIEELWELGYLPIEIKALEEGTLCPIGIPMLTIRNTNPKFGWLVNYLETLLSCTLWQPITSATIAHEYRKLLDKWAIKTTGSTEGVQWQGHDFSMRGMSSPESAILSGMGHLLSFTGTDVIPALYQLERSYDATGLIGASVPATEHSVMCMDTKESEIETFRRLLKLHPTGILSVVSDTWDLWKVCTEHLPALKEEILARDGKLVIRPDSGDPVDIICGKNSHPSLSNSVKCFTDLNERGREGSGKRSFGGEIINEQEFKGVIELLWDVFGGTENEKGYKVLNPCIGAIYGDSITLERAEQICKRLEQKGFASTNIVLGIGSYTYQYNTRDTFGFAMKATYGEILHPPTETANPNIEAREIFKDPITDDGTKKSKKGLLMVYEEENGDIMCIDQCSWAEEDQGLLKTVFYNGRLTRRVTLDEVREKLNS